MLTGSTANRCPKCTTKLGRAAHISQLSTALFRHYGYRLRLTTLTGEKGDHSGSRVDSATQCSLANRISYMCFRSQVRRGPVFVVLQFTILEKLILSWSPRSHMYETRCELRVLRISEVHVFWFSISFLNVITPPTSRMNDFSFETIEQTRVLTTFKLAKFPNFRR